MNSNEILDYVLGQKVSPATIEGIHGALRAAPRYSIPESVIVSIYLKVVRVYLAEERLLEALEAAEETRLLKPTDLSVLKHIIRSLESFLGVHKDDLCQADLAALNRYFDLILEETTDHSASHYIHGRLGKLKTFRHAISASFNTVQGFHESRYTKFLTNLTMLKYNRLTPEQRLKEYSKILGKKVLEYIRVKQTQKAALTSEVTDA